MQISMEQFTPGAPPLLCLNTPRGFIGARNVDRGAANIGVRKSMDIMHIDSNEPNRAIILIHNIIQSHALRLRERASWSLPAGVTTSARTVAINSQSASERVSQSAISIGVGVDANLTTAVRWRI
ncbi:hypothetical protein EVAR_77514_1 [Eumeta japonica]|uniref:Uncharacterized protein n=1 Tax=Eumeta variegata TaxID=151549 RepID=A0A4C1T7H5_EUMVA|nr:hypothetical protein EVAR_77514_1 [Eumeta japonica]